MKKFVFLLAWLTLSIPVFSSHILGGQIYWTALGNHQYIFTVELLRHSSTGSAMLGTTSTITTNIPNLPTISSTQISVTPIAPECASMTGAREIDLHTYQSSVVTIPIAPSGSTGWNFIVQSCCLSTDSAINIVHPHYYNVYLRASMFAGGINQSSPRIDFNVVFQNRRSKEVLIPAISRNALPVQLDLFRLRNTPTEYALYRPGYSHLKPTSTNDTLLPSGLFISNSSLTTGMAYIGLRCLERDLDGSYVSATYPLFAFSFNTSASTLSVPSITDSGIQTSYSNSNGVLHVKADMGQHIRIKLRGTANVGPNSPNTAIKATLNDYSTSHLNITQPSLVRSDGSTNTMDTGSVEVIFDYTIPNGFPSGTSRYDVNFIDYNCPINGTNNRIIEIENTDKYQFDNYICEGDSFLLISPRSGNTFQWFPSLGVSSPTDSITYVRPNTINTYHLVVDGDTIAQYNFGISRQIKPSIQLTSSNILTLTNPQDYSFHQLYWFYTKVRDASNDTIYPLSKEGVYHIQGGLDICAEYSDSISILGSGAQYSCIFDKFYHPSDDLTLRASDFMSFSVDFQSNFNPNKIEEIFIPQGIASNSANITLDYKTKNMTYWIQLQGQIQSDNSVVFPLNIHNLTAAGKSIDFRLVVNSGEFLLPVITTGSTPIGSSNTEVVSIGLKNGSQYFSSKFSQFVFVTEGDVGIKSIDNTFNIYPQPADSRVIIESAETNAAYILTDMNGRIIREGTVSDSKSIETEDLQNGFYLLQVSGSHGRDIHKLVIQH